MRFGPTCLKPRRTSSQNTKRPSFAIWVTGADQIVIDIGGGKSCPFAKHANAEARTTIVALDISAEELRSNADVTLKVVGDLTGRMPMGNETADLIVSRSVLEHLEDLDSFMRECLRVLKKGGYTIHLWPSKYAPFAVLNQVLPNFISKRLLRFFHPGFAGICGFPAFYHQCFYSAMKDVLQKNSFRIVGMELDFEQSSYFNFFVPIFLLTALYEALIRRLGIKNMCAFVLVVAQKI